MIGSEDLGKIEKVDALRNIWPDEARDFTPWLAKNLPLLGEALGFDLELQAKEAKVGTFSLDLLAYELSSNRPAIIENQLDDTNHLHLGQLLTYASGYDAYTVIWIAKTFRDEHRAALDWLNKRTDEETQFFGVVVELLKIDDSRLAPHFDVVSAPNDWSRGKAGSSNSTRNPSERMERYRKFYQILVDTLRECHNFTNSRRASPKNEHDFSSGFSGFIYRARFNNSGQVGVALYIDRDGDSKEQNERDFDRLKEQKEPLEAELGPLAWERLDNNRACRIEAKRDGSIDDDEEALEEIRIWMVQKFLAFKEAFGSRLPVLREGD